MLGCGDDGSGPGGGGGGSADGGSGGSTSNGSTNPEISSVTAPTRTTVRVALTFAPDAIPDAGKYYELTSDFGPLTVESAELDASGPAIVLTTDPQKLGVEYHLVIKQPGNALDFQSGTFLSADTATFWASDFGDPNFAPYEVNASRAAIGQHVVIYLADGIDASDVDDTVAFFDEQIFPKETALFTDAPDRDENGKVLLLGLDGGGYYGGYFDPTNSLTEAQAQQFGQHSNELEMLYISIPDLQGSFDPTQVVAHEFQHLLYNETHDYADGDWSWHNEGLAECAVGAVSGTNPVATYYYTEPDSGLATGQSLVNWTFSNYSQYAQAYVFWTYVASRLGGLDGYGQIFQETGKPSDMDAFFQAKLGETFAEVQMDMLVATVRREATGPLGFEGLVDFTAPTLTVPAGTTSLALGPFTGVLFPVATDGLTPSGQGPNVLHVGVPTVGALDVVAPFDVAGGVVIALNANQSTNGSDESSGTLGAGVAGPSPVPLLPSLGPTWKHPPPLRPDDRSAVKEWRRLTAGF